MAKFTPEAADQAVYERDDDAPPYHPGDTAAYRTLNAEQRRAVDTVLEAVARPRRVRHVSDNDDDDDDPFALPAPRRAAPAAAAADAPSLFWLDGAAGCGKSYVTRMIMDFVRRIEGSYGAVLGCAFQGNAACNLELGSSTLHHAFSIGAHGKKGLGVVLREPVFLRKSHPDLRLVVFDEISMIPADIFAVIDSQMRKVYDPTKPFGGIVVLANGDFLQLPPVKGKALHIAVLTATGRIDPNLDRKNVPAGMRDVIGADLWRSAVRLQLVDVVRAGNCPVQLARLREMRRTMTYTKAAHEGIKTLTREEVQPGGAYEMHRSLHGTNDGRIAAGRLHQKIAAERTNTFTYHWRGKLPEKVAKLNLPGPMLDAFYNAHPAMNQEFQRGTPMMLLENVCVAVGLANGATGVAHRLCFADKDRGAVVAAERAARAARSVVVQLPAGVMPLFVQISFDVPRNAAGNPRALPGNVEHGRWIVPIAPSRADQIPVAGIEGSALGSMRPMAFQLTQARSLTVHKAQGMEICNCALDISKKTKTRGGTNTTFETLYVAVSRAPTDDDLRVLPLAEGYSADYLFGKKAKPQTRMYLDPANWGLDGRFRIAPTPAPQIRARTSSANATNNKKK